MPSPAKQSSSLEPRLRVVDRDQFVLRAMNIEQLMAADHSARALWEFVGRLDLSKFYEPIKAVEGRPGQPVNDPQLMISLWLYASCRSIAVRLAKACAQDMFAAGDVQREVTVVIVVAVKRSALAMQRQVGCV